MYLVGYKGLLNGEVYLHEFICKHLNTEPSWQSVQSGKCSDVFANYPSLRTLTLHKEFTVLVKKYVFVSGKIWLNQKGLLN